jgi:DNA-binding PadR family transcriptional regulator
MRTNDLIDISIRYIVELMLELAVLGLLADQPRHGYELKKRLSETLGPLWGISFGSLYPALRRLERAGLIEEVDETEGAPVASPIVPTGSVKGDLAAARLRRRARPGRRTRKAYRITDAGRQHFTELLTESAADDERTFALKLSFCRYLEPADRLAFLERRRTQLADRLASTRRRPVTRTIDRYTRSLLEHRASSTQHDLEWIDELIAQERSEQLDRPEGATA